MGIKLIETVHLETTTIIGIVVVSAIVVAIATKARNRFRLTLLPATVLHEFAHMLVGRVFGGRNQHFKISPDATAITTQTMAIVKGPGTWFGVFMTTFAGYFAPPIAGILIALGQNYKISPVVAITTLILFYVMTFLSQNLFSVLIMLLTTLSLTGITVLVWGNVYWASFAMIVFAIHTVISGIGQALDQVLNVTMGSPEFCDAGILSESTGIPAAVWAGIHLLVSVTGAVLTIGLLI